MNVREVVYLAPLCVLVFWMGLFPMPFVHTVEKTLAHLHGQLEVFFH